jgi:hypothetical protein
VSIPEHPTGALFEGLGKTSRQYRDGSPEKTKAAD